MFSIPAKTKSWLVRTLILAKRGDQHIPKEGFRYELASSVSVPSQKPSAVSVCIRIFLRLSNVTGVLYWVDRIFANLLLQSNWKQVCHILAVGE